MLEAYTVALLVEGVDLDDVPTIDALFDLIPSAVPSSVDGIVTITARIGGATGDAAALLLAEQVESVAPSARAIRVDQDFVAISDIAERLERTRESVRLLVEGKRGPGSFPSPAGTVGDGIRVWPWAVVVDWVHKALSAPLEHVISPEEAAIADACLAQRRRQSDRPAAVVGHMHVRAGPEPVVTFNVCIVEGRAKESSKSIAA